MSKRSSEIILAMVLCAIFFITGCEKNTEGVLEDSRDGKTYKTLTFRKAGDTPLIWMIDPLGGDTSFYMYKDAKKACPDGWRLPTLAETMSLMGKNSGDMDAQTSHISFYIPKGRISEFAQDCYRRFFTSDGFRVYMSSSLDDKNECSVSIMTLEGSVKAGRRLVAISRWISNGLQGELDEISPEGIAQEAEEWREQIYCVK